ARAGAGARVAAVKVAREKQKQRFARDVIARVESIFSGSRLTVHHAILCHAAGGPEVLQLEAVEVGEPGPGQARVRHAAVGVNYIDTYHRGGLYPLPLPSGLGNEAAGVVEAVGPGVDWVKPGDRVATGTGPLGAYSTA